MEGVAQVVRAFGVGGASPLPSTYKPGFIPTGLHGCIGDVLVGSSPTSSGNHNRGYCWTYNGRTLHEIGGEDKS